GEEEIEKDMKAFRESIKINDLPDEYLRNHSKLTLAMKRVIADQGFDAVSLRCWPEMGQMKFTPCAMLSRLADEGIIIGCEADVNATISMLIGHSFSGKIPFMCDLIDIDEQENTALFWHCGQAARELHDDSDNTCVCDHSMAGQGVVIEGTLKPGKVTVSLVVQIGDEYKMFLASGEAVPTKKVIKGVMVNVKMNYPVRDMLYRIAEEGIPHHYSIVWADIADDLKALASHLGIETIET
ncbi:MAG: fucose isomerase, partial [Planctomycetes bacterium]|nr:fucose isomerase [Planctomycetota bacterium]